jgi:uncharacterized protein YutE (UPF0331/DUF86 family)
MDWLQFIASLIKSLAWPITIVFLVVFFRTSIRRAFLKLTRLKYKDLELDFGYELKQIEKEAKAIDIVPQPSRDIGPSKRDSSHLLQEAAELAQRFPEPAVAVAWQAIEDELMQAVMRLGISPDYPAQNSAHKNAELLKAQGAIDERTIELLSRMRNLRNMAVHGGHGPDNVTHDEALEILALARGVVEKLRALRRN